MNDFENQMNGNKFLKILICIIIILFILSILILKSNSVKSKTVQQYSQGVNDGYFDKFLFLEGIKSAEGKKINPAKTIQGGIIPHHQLSGFIQADFFRRLSFQKPKTIILFGPNHNEKGGAKIITSDKSWQTPFGTVLTDTKIINDIIKLPKTLLDSDIVLEEYSIGNIVPYIKYYIPDATIVPVIFSHNMDLNNLESFSRILSPYINNNTVIIASVDFSHYLSYEKALENDKSTLELIKNRDYEKLFKLNSDYLDSPPSIIEFTIIMDKLGNSNSEILYHTNSGEITGNKWEETTSYYSIVYYE